MAAISDFCHTSDGEESDGVLGLGTTRIEIVVTGEDSATTQTYTIDVHRNFENTSEPLWAPLYSLEGSSATSGSLEGWLNMSSWGTLSGVVAGTALTYSLEIDETAWQAAFGSHSSSLANATAGEYDFSPVPALEFQPRVKVNGGDEYDVGPPVLVPKGGFCDEGSTCRDNLCIYDTFPENYTAPVAPGPDYVLYGGELYPRTPCQKNVTFSFTPTEAGSHEFYVVSPERSPLGSSNAPYKVGQRTVDYDLWHSRMTLAKTNVSHPALFAGENSIKLIGGDDFDNLASNLSRAYDPADITAIVCPPSNPSEEADPDCFCGGDCPVFTTAEVSLSGDPGIYDLDVNIPVAGENSIYVRGTRNGTEDLMEPYPFKVKVQPGVIGARSIVEPAPEASQRTIGYAEPSFYVRALDKFNTPISAGGEGHLIEVRLSPMPLDASGTPLSATSPFSMTESEDLGNGSYRFRVPTFLSANFNVTLLIDGAETQDSPFVFPVFAGDISGESDADFPAEALAGDPTTIYVYLRDTYGNVVKEGSHESKIKFLLDGAEYSHSVEKNAISGAYDLTFEAPRDVAQDYFVKIAVEVDNSTTFDIVDTVEGHKLNVVPNNAVPQNSVFVMATEQTAGAVTIGVSGKDLYNNTAPMGPFTAVASKFEGGKVSETFVGVMQTAAYGGLDSSNSLVFPTMKLTGTFSIELFSENATIPAVGKWLKTQGEQTLEDTSGFPKSIEVVSDHVSINSIVTQISEVVPVAQSPSSLQPGTNLETLRRRPVRPTS